MKWIIALLIMASILLVGCSQSTEINPFVNTPTDDTTDLKALEAKAVENLDVELCYQLNGTGYTGGRQNMAAGTVYSTDRCIETIAIKTQNISLCENISVERIYVVNKVFGGNYQGTQEVCYNDIIGNYSGDCDSLSTLGEQICLMDRAIKANDLDSCSDLTSFERDNCILETAGDKLTQEHCDSFINEWNLRTGINLIPPCLEKLEELNSTQ